ncbi:FAD-binding and (Fe-S)-binding domain-containing protein [Helicobacter bizzozeronii]|uniref:FAD-binding and (Fe-S)-binding domain-containing protein n=1 Tax=Helicobacter bizzozeronii TaxID=56877 RepID=UPI000CEEEEF3|nr:FAD-binding and (Fe-S)-binding domain-containing protein [Helicobacter bizzozeronii]
MTLSSSYEAFYSDAQVFLKDRIYADYLRRLVYGTDASCYRYVPQLVIKALDEIEIIRILSLARYYQIPLTFRAAGSSLSGQACSEGVLVMTHLGWQDMQIAPDSSSIRLSCGVIGGYANEALKGLHKKIGPDPASINVAMLGGILANNSSGMCCGVKNNSYNTLKSLRVILADGTLLDTSSPSSVQAFRQSHANLLQSLLDLRAQVLKDSDLHALIKKKYQIKNTTGYSLNALIDFEDPIDILSHLFIGSEGTLGFIASCELECVDDAPFKECLLLFYEDLPRAIETIRILAQNDDKISAAELMDHACLVSVRGLEGMPAILEQVQKNTTCILVQLEHQDAGILRENTAFVLDAIAHIPTILPTQQSDQPSIYNSWWNIRKGIFPIITKRRRAGASVITEDLCFDMDHIQEGLIQLQGLLDQHGFKDNGVIFGHALSGNLHFLITPLLENPTERSQFSALMEDLASMVVSLQGSIKAEHGTGRMVAPFVKLEWGDKAYALCEKIKALFDPLGILNPDVILSKDPHIHTKNLKTNTPIEPELESCIECGICERICPSRYLSLTPRQRIVLHREITRLEERVKQGHTEDQALLEELLEGYAYLSDETCAACHMCATLCPVQIDSATIALKSRQKHAKGKGVAKQILAHMDKSIGMVKWGLGLARNAQVILGAKKVRDWSLNMHAKCGTPLVPTHLPLKNRYKLQDRQNGEKSVIYFSTCMNRAFAPSKMMADRRSIQEVFESLCAKAQFSVIYPKNLAKLCCGKAFINYTDLSAQNTQKNAQLLKELSQNGKIPIVLDHSACSTHLIAELGDQGLKIYDLAIFIAQEILPHLQLKPSPESVGLYTMCAAKRAGYEKEMLNLAHACVGGEVVVHAQTGCCGFAGDKGFISPELNQHALIDFAKFYAQKGLKKGFCSSSTCEIGLSESTGMSWQHIAYLVDACSK